MKKAASRVSGRTVDEYLARVPEAQRAALSRIRTTIRRAAPEALESISYGIPTYKQDGRPLRVVTMVS